MLKFNINNIVRDKILEEIRRGEIILYGSSEDERDFLLDFLKESECSTELVRENFTKAVAKYYDIYKDNIVDISGKLNDFMQENHLEAIYNKKFCYVSVDDIEEFKLYYNLPFKLVEVNELLVTELLYQLLNNKVGIYFEHYDDIEEFQYVYENILSWDTEVTYDQTVIINGSYEVVEKTNEECSVIIDGEGIENLLQPDNIDKLNLISKYEVPVLICSSNYRFDAYFDGRHYDNEEEIKDDISTHSRLSQLQKTKGKKFLDFMNVENQEKTEQFYVSRLEDFNGHREVKFTEDEEGQPSIKFYEGCTYGGIYGLKEFEQNVQRDYGGNKQCIQYRTYMLEADKLRLALGLPAREQKLEFVAVRGLQDLIKIRKEYVTKYLQDLEGNYYSPKNHMWFDLAEGEEPDFKYMESEDGYDSFYYDLVTVAMYANEKQYDIAIPVPVLSDALQVGEKTIYKMFDKKYERDQEEWI